MDEKVCHYDLALKFRAAGGSVRGKASPARRLVKMGRAGRAPGSNQIPKKFGGRDRPGPAAGRPEKSPRAGGSGASQDRKRQSGTQAAGGPISSAGRRGGSPRAPPPGRRGGGPCVSGQDRTGAARHTHGSAKGGARFIHARVSGAVSTRATAPGPSRIRRCGKNRPAPRPRCAGGCARHRPRMRPARSRAPPGRSRWARQRRCR